MPCNTAFSQPFTQKRTNGKRSGEGREKEKWEKEKEKNRYDVWCKITPLKEKIQEKKEKNSPYPCFSQKILHNSSLLFHW